MSDMTTDGGKRQLVEIESREHFDAHVEGGGSMRNVVVQGVDLRERSDDLMTRSLKGAVFLGCEMESMVLEQAARDGALVFPRIPGKPFLTCPGRLYTAEDLFDGFDHRRPETYEETYDARVYRHWRESNRDDREFVVETLARRLHDHGITDAGQDLLRDCDPPREVVAVMGGHGMRRDGADYRQVAHLARRLTRQGFFMVSGGGPGAMEATHLGAWFARRDESALEEAFEMLAEFPGFDAERKGEWLAPAFRVRERFPLEGEDRAACQSLGVPTWFYGHEPPNPFATHIAKYFANSVREAGLLAVATSGVIYSPGSAGTIQEIFQDACQNHYVTAGVVSPMIFLGEEYWTRTRPVYPLLEQLAREHEYALYLSITDSNDDVVARLEEYRRDQSSKPRELPPAE